MLSGFELYPRWVPLLLMAHFACVKFPDFSFKGNISKKERASERKNEGALSFFLSLALSFSLLPNYRQLGTG